jgi:DNA-binding transcriptional ArsR family regulator
MPSTKSARKKPAVLKGGNHAMALAHPVASLLKDLSAPTRLQVLLALADGPECVSQICERMGRSQPELSHHLALLRASNVIVSHRQGSKTCYELSDLGAQVVDFTEKLREKVDLAPKPALTESE